jgi:hypothetical protein
MKLRGLFGISLVGLVALTGFGQVATADKYLITAKAGGVNLVQGEVTISRSDGRSGLLVKGDEVQIGERVTTGSDGRAEILMNPGSYIRLGSNSSFEFASTDLDDVRLKMHKGTAILEVFGTDGFQVDLSTDTARFTLLDSGVYRIDAAPNGSSTVAVWRGKLRAGTDEKTSFGRGKVVTFDGKAYIAAKFDRDDMDTLSVWSRERSKELSKISASLRPSVLRDPLINSFRSSRWDLYNSFGLWVYNPFARSFCFLPFGYGWSSPYGYGFGRSIWFYNLPAVIYNQPPPPSSSARVLNPKRSGSQVRSIGSEPSNSDSGSSKRASRDIFRDIVPREQRAIEPRFDFPRIDPAPPVVKAPPRRTRDQ